MEINIKPERVDEFLTVFRANHEGAIKEPGNLRFDVLQDPRVKTRFFIYEPIKTKRRCWRISRRRTIWRAWISLRT